MQTRRQLAQVRPSGTTGTSLFSLSSQAPFVVDFVNIANVSGASLAVSLFHDIDGSTYDETTALIFEQTLAAGAVIHFEAPICDYQVAGNIGCKVSVADGATFTVYGSISGERL
jgi:hypothetical protein